MDSGCRVMLVAFEFDGVFYVSNLWEGGLGGGGVVASSYLERCLIQYLKRPWLGLDLGGFPLDSLPPYWTGFSIGFFFSGFSTGFFCRFLHWILLPLLHNRAWGVLHWIFCHYFIIGLGGFSAGGEGGAPGIFFRLSFSTGFFAILGEFSMGFFRPPAIVWIVPHGFVDLQGFQIIIKTVSPAITLVRLQQQSELSLAPSIGLSVMHHFLRPGEES